MITKNGMSNGKSNGFNGALTLAQGNLSADRRDAERRDQAKAQVQAQRAEAVAQGGPDDLRAELARLRAENEALKQSQAKKTTLSMKVSEKGAASLYGLGRFPVTLYRGQWERLLGAAEDIKAFLAANADVLKTKE